MFWRKKEERAATVSVSDRIGFAEFFGLSGDAGVSTEDALGVPAVWAAINFLSGTLAGLPLNVYKTDSKGNKKKLPDSPAYPFVKMLHKAVNEDYSSFQWRFDKFNGIFTSGRGVSYIERDSIGRPINIYPIPSDGLTVERLANGRKRYKSSVPGFPEKSWDQADVIDIPFMLRPDLLGHRSPLRQCAVAIGKAVNSNEYGSKLFKNNGLPAFVMQGPFNSEATAVRASENMSAAATEAARKGANVLAIPAGHELKPLSSDPSKMQLVDTQSFAVVEIARIYSLPPTFLQDLSRATFSNSEQQDLHLVKHTLKRWVEQFEAEMNLKLFGRDSKIFVEFNVDGLLRGDYKTRMEGNSTAIQTGQLTPNEARAMDNREPLDGGDRLLIQGATIPLATAGQTDTPETEEDGGDDA